MAQLSVQLMGAFQVTRDGAPVAGFVSDKVRALLAYLAVEGAQPQRRETLAGLLWGEYPDRSARDSLRNALANLRRVIGDREAQPPYLHITPQAVQLHPEGEVWVDVSAFTQAVGDLSHLLEKRGIDQLESAVALYRGGFLEGFSLPDSAAFEEWALLVREQLQRRMLAALGALVEGYERRGDVERALAHAWRLVELEPYPEAAQRQLMCLLTANGQRELALAQYERYCRLLSEDLGVAPGQETAGLHEEIRDGEDLTGLFNLSGLRVPLYNLPAQSMPFVGREKELAELQRLLAEPGVRLVTLIGPGGIGKTRLALQCAEEVVAGGNGFRDGIYFVRLVSARTVEVLVSTVAQAIGFSFPGGGDPRARLLRYLRGKRMLLVLDNVEQLIASSEGDRGSDRRGEGAEFLAEVLRAAPGVLLLVTSRVRLNVSGEHVLALPGMNYPSQDLTSGRWESSRWKSSRWESSRWESGGKPDRSVEGYSAVQLYLQQARCVRPGYEADHEPLAEIGRICRMVEGMPLAIVLAAAWMDVLSPGEIAAELERSITFLRGELHDLPSRHRSMVAAFDVSWGMLTDAEREAFAGLSVFQGGCTREAAEAVAGADLEILRALTQKSFLTRNADGRYHVHELLRQYAEAKLRERSGAWERALDQHCTYYTEYLVQYEASFRKSGPGEAGDEISNVSAAWRWMLDRDKVAACRRAIGGFYWLDPGWAWCRARRPLLEGTIALLRRAEPSRENRIALGMALCYTAQPEIGADLEHARVLAQEGHQILTELDARHELAEAKIYAYFAGIAQDEVHAERLLQESLSLARETGRPEIEAWALGFLGVRCFTRALRTGAPSTEAMQQVQAFYARSLEIRRRIGHRRGEANLLFEQGLCMHAVGRYAEARSLYEKSLAYYRTVGMQASILICLGTLGMLALQVGDYSAAEAAFQEYMQKGQAWDDQVTARYGPCGLADVALAMGQARKAASIRRQVLQDTIEDGLFAERILFSFAQSSAQEGRWTRAAELLALAYTLVYPGFWNIVTVCGGMELEREVRGALPPDVYAAAQERGRARDVEGTLRELLAELEDEGLPDPP